MHSHIDVSNGRQRPSTRLADFPLLDNLSPGLLRHIELHAAPIKGKQRKLLFLRGDPEDFIGLVLQGSVYHTLQEPDGHEVIIDYSCPGELVGESALLHPGLRNCTAQLSRDCHLLALHRQHFRDLQNDPLLMSRIQQQLCRRLQRISSFVETVCLYRLEARLARHLLTEIDQHGHPGPDGPTLPLTINQTILAAMLNASRPRLNAQLKQWQRAGLIQLTRHALKVCDPARLRQIAQHPN
ncbi:Crp/Fnr family transcriptional regulator [Chromobacterium piscinae]|uniref:Crp/Fnr family transcriptional regulator n=1 Tax=Chromobacterium piscinae TaxID=686831 RepID=UPI001C8BA828|nr:Crp/Fnr family transcriptional regulator [Chromobacterium piscinae]MBX9297445.1 Crp/Fnr family transcriptional regulator [Chromobacterium vaccinii]MBX9355759.1 Crp/Fnr family transcriptional regulator [Chromobacterium vaccinii]MCD4502993.1 Crp/Fnr family transcriptional regulator [Chromobacterium piscinae]MCD5328805.1 Crp/Fnr family transcriptional regulator [Chromobacterium piscinae]